MQPQNDAIKQLLEQYDLGDTGGDPHEGSVPVRVAPQQQRPAGIPATKAVPPKDPETGRFLPAQVQPSAANAQHQETSEEPLLDSETGQPVQHSRVLYRHAVQTGFTDQEIDSTPSEQLQQMVFDRQQEMFSKATQQQAPNVSAIEKPAPKPEPEPVVDFGEFESDENLDPKLRGVLKGHLTEQLKKLKAIEARLEETAKREEAREKADKQRAFDNHIDKVFAKHTDLVGSESISDLYEGHPNLDRRRDALALANIDKSKKSVQEKIDTAIAKLAPSWGVTVQTETQQPQPGARPSAQQWANGGVPRPTQRKPQEEVNDVRRARQAVEQRLSQLTQPGSNGSVDVEDFPG